MFGNNRKPRTVTVEFLSDQWVEVGDDTHWDEQLNRPVGSGVAWITQGTRVDGETYSDADGVTWITIRTPSFEDVETDFPIIADVCRIVE